MISLTKRKRLVSGKVSKIDVKQYDERNGLETVLVNMADENTSAVNKKNCVSSRDSKTLLLVPCWPL
jgi:hypothetical protein